MERMWLVAVVASTALQLAIASPNIVRKSVSAVAQSRSLTLPQSRSGFPGPHTVEITTRDGINLHTVYALPGNDSRKYPTVIDRSPYGDDGTELVADAFLLFGFAAVEQDFRGTKQSGGEFDLWRYSYNDTEDTIKWIVAQPWSNGVVHIAGGSADGIAALVLGAKPALPEIKSQFIVWASGDPYSSVFVGGAYRYGLIHNWLKHYINKNDPAALEAEVYKHESPLDPWWSAVTPDYSGVTAPTVFWAGWNDIFLNGNIEAFNGWQKATGGKSWLLIDAEGHCQNAHSDYPRSGIEGRVALGALLGISMFLDELNDPPNGIPEKVKHITFFVMGSNHSASFGGFYTTMDEWPAFTPTKFYLHGDGVMRLGPSTEVAHRTFSYDPTNPVPTLGGNNLEIPCGPKDQRPIENRSDVLLYTSEKLIAPLAVVGKLSVTLTVSSANVNDTDWTAKLSDVYPDGTSHLIQDGIIRMRWRKRTLNPVPLSPNVIETVVVDLWSTAYVFDPGHQIRVAISSSNSPRFLANPNTGLPLTALPAAPIIAQNTLHTGQIGESSAHLTLPVVKLSDLPKHEVI